MAETFYTPRPRVRHYSKKTPIHERDSPALADNQGGAKTKALRIDYSPPERLAVRSFSWEE